jgi:hypothetical protein
MWRGLEWMHGTRLAAASLIILLAAPAPGQSVPASPQERVFPQSKAVVEKAIKAAGPISGRLPTLDGFAVSDSRPVGRFQRGFYELSVAVTPAPSGTKVKVAAKITAWYADPVASKSGYESLPSNGRLELDFLDRLQDGLGVAEAEKPAERPAPKAAGPAPPVPDLSAPMPRLPSVSSPLTGSALTTPNASPSSTSMPIQTQLTTDRRLNELRQEAKNLMEILQNQSHPANLVAVKTEGAPILMSPAEGAKVVFNANAEDEFEVLDTNADWVHVRVVGLSRGWIRKSNLELPESADKTAVDPAEVFHITKQQVGSFPGDWEPLRGKEVKIVSVQTATDMTTASKAKIAYARGVFDSQYAKLGTDPQPAAGIVVVFDTADGGMVAATQENLEKWKTGSMSDEDFWKVCFFDPPEMSGASANR